MIEKSEINHYLLEEIQEELAPRVIGDCGHTAELSKEKVSSLYHALSIFLSRNSDNKLMASVTHSFGEIS
ncbi:hypothetical protein [Acinetobacter bereziniae]|uniref:hypothetical protein n=1 Tax=Acinetobacter bereziniae TaxID=106648 RepID=UPI00066541B3|nr:hypothetical protein [Acinetobacter bereziniae]